MGLIITPPFRISFPENIFSPGGYQGSEPTYGLTAIWNLEDLQTKYKASWLGVLKALDAKAREFFDTPLSKLPANIRRGIRNGDEKAHLNGYGDGTLFAALSSKRKPQIIDLRKELIPDGDTVRIYPGAWARASVSPYAYDNIGKGVALGLNNVQWLGHGDRLDSVTDAATDFEADPDDIWFQQEQAHAGEDQGSTGRTAGPDPADGFEDDIPF